MRGYATIRYRKTNTYGGGFSCATLEIRRGWNGMVEIKFRGSPSTPSTLEYVEVEVPLEIAQTIAWAIQGVLEGYTDMVRKEYKGNDSD